MPPMRATPLCPPDTFYFINTQHWFVDRGDGKGPRPGLEVLREMEREQYPDFDPEAK